MPATSVLTFVASAPYFMLPPSALRMFSMPWRNGASVGHFLPWLRTSFASLAAWPWSCDAWP